jgi:hypothetical protein
MPSDEDLRRVSRRLRDLVEPIAANVYFAKEAGALYKDLGLRYLPGYFCSRSACMGQVAPEVVVATFGVFNPAIVKPAVEEGWSKTTATALLAARQQGAIASLERLLFSIPGGVGGVPDGAARATELLRKAGEAAPVPAHPLFAGLLSLGFPGDPLGDLWRAADLVREHRGDTHVAAWAGYGVDAVEITLLTELWWKIPLDSYVRTRGWSEDEITAGLARLRERGLIDGDSFTDAGEALRGAIERVTDLGERSIVAALGDDADELLGLLEPMARAIVESGGYPSDPSQLTRM